MSLPNQISIEQTNLVEQIARCRRLAKEAHDQRTIKTLLAMASEYELKLSSIAEKE